MEKAKTTKKGNCNLENLNLEKVNRFEVINHCKNDYPFGRMVTMYKSMDDFKNIELQLQDGGKTLKIFIS